jgi:hypothetical protein
MRRVLYLTLGVVAFLAITLFEQLPIIGWLGGIISIAAWWYLTRHFVDDATWDFDAPITLTWSAVIGAVTGLAGAFTAWLTQTGNLFGFTTPPGDRFGAFFGFIGATLGIVLWPLFGAAVCAVAALMTLRVRRPAEI